MITKETADFSRLDFQAGETILIDKPFKWSSFKVVHKIRQAVGVRRVGHAGTLDPMATGLLIICTGKKTKEITRFQDLPKTYAGKILLGKTSPSMDLETEVTDSGSTKEISVENILNVRNTFVGKIQQIPPMFSAVKVKGKSLYKIARKGKEVEREPREVEIYKFEIKKVDLPEIEFEIVCSKGTYIRAIAHDFGEKLGCGGLLSELKRTQIGDYSVENALAVAEIITKIQAAKDNLIESN